MISAVRNISFAGESAQDIINAESKFTAPQPLPETPQDSFEGKKSHKALAATGTIAALALAAFAGLGYAVKSGKLAKVENADAIEKFAEKYIAKAKNIGVEIGEKAISLYEKIAGKFGQKAEQAAQKAEEAV